MPRSDGDNNQASIKRGSRFKTRLDHVDATAGGPAETRPKARGETFRALLDAIPTIRVLDEPDAAYDISIAPLHNFQRCFEGPGFHFAIAPGIEIIGCAGENDWHGLIGLGPVDVRAEADAIPHGHHHFLVNDSGSLEFLPDGGFVLCPQCCGAEKKGGEEQTGEEGEVFHTDIRLRILRSM